MALVVDSAKAQEVTPGRIELSKNDSNASRVSALRRDFTDAIVYGAPRKVIERLIDRRRQSDTELTDQLKQIVQQLAEIPKSAVDAKSRQISAKLKRARSLAWLARIELLSLQSECFASGSADAISTSQQTIELIGQAVSNLPNGSEVRGEVDRLLVEAHLHAGDGWSAQSATTDDSSTDVAIGPEKLALLIRIDLANQKLDEASAKLRSFFGADPADAPVSMKMDFAYLQFLMHKSKQDIRHEQFIGDWLEAIEKRNGWVSRRRAETILARHREEVVDEVHKQTDPRLQIADARYYIRVGKPLPAAISFAQAAVQDEQSNRSIESAVSSASILQQLSKQAAAAELLLQVAERHPNEGTTPNLFLQAATLLSQTVPAERDKIQAVLQRCLKDWPDTPAAVKARDWMVELTVAEGRTIEAAILATRMPDLHWNMETASRCQNLWLTAATESDDANVVFHTMNTVFDEVTTDVTNPLLVQTKMQLWVLLADDLDRVSKAGTSIDNQFLKELASLRHSPDAQHLSQVRSHVDDSFTQILKWRIERDIEQRPKKAKPLAALLLKTLPNSG
ncbi:unnamed protein product, partial [Hapterophycus canaliculatus]